GGGGGGSVITEPPNSGGSGVVIIRYPSTQTGGTSGNHGTPTGTTYTNAGKIGGARSFNGTSDYISFADTDSLSFTSSSSTFSISAWILPTSLPASDKAIFTKYNSNNGTMEYAFVTNGSQLRMYLNEAGNYTNYVKTTTDANLTLGVWQHVVVTVNMATDTVNFYKDSVLLSGSSTGTYPTDLPNLSASPIIGSMTCGAGTLCNFWSGSMDEIYISRAALTANEIAESYKLGKDTYINQTLNTIDLSTKETMAINIASDRPGTYLSTTWGESAYANYQPDANTAGLWHMDEIGGSGAYIQSATGNNHGTPTGTTINDGKIGYARYIGGSNYITVSDSNSLDISDNLTIDAWIYPTAEYSGYAVHPINKGNAATTSDNFVLYYFGTSGTSKAIRFYATAGGTWKAISGEYILSLNNWYHIALSYSSGSGGQLYINGMPVGVATGSGTLAINDQPLRIGGNWGGNASFPGVIDELRIGNTVRTADQIRQAYEVGLRTHNITVTFGAGLASGNLITNSGDTSFNIDATKYGLPSLGSELYPGDKVIVKENYNGTESIAQGTVSSVNLSTGAVTVSSWDSGSTFPSSGYTVNADVFKWQKEYIPVKNRTISNQVDATNLLTFRLNDGNEGRNIWIDDLRSSTGYLKNSSSEAVTFPSEAQYVQYKAIFTSLDSNVTPYLSQVQLDYASGDSTPALEQLMKHGKWFDSSGVKKGFWWVGTH
ncbi:LamG domain-containing protein, partial [Patescibacteria group bacterium]|nr:LamG domain-containing protein [Patescibacteria group bacterium]